MSIYDTKICTICKTEKTVTEFFKRKKSKDGFESKCKSCKTEYANVNKERIANYISEYQKANKEQVNKRNAAYKRNNKSKIASLTAKRKSIKLQSTPSWFEYDLVEEVYSQCKQLTDSTGIKHHVDHIIPLQSDLVCGLHCLANLQILTAEENMTKNNRRWPDMP